MALLARGISKLLRTPAFIGLCCAMAVVLVATTLRHEERLALKRQVQTKTEYANAELSWELRLIDLSMRRMVRRMEHTPAPSQAAWTADAQAYLNDFPSLTSIRWHNLNAGEHWRVAEANEALADPVNADDPQIERALAEQSMLVDVHLDDAVAVRRAYIPTQPGASCVGVLATSLDLNQLATDILREEANLGYTFRIEPAGSGPGALTPPLHEQYELHEGPHTASAPRTLPWRVVAQPRDEVVRSARSWVAELVLVIGLLCSVLVMVLARVLRSARARESQLHATHLRLEEKKREHDRSEAARRESDALLSAVLENLPAMVYIKNPDGRHRFANRASERALNMDAASIIGRRDDEVLPEKVAASLMANDQRVLDTGEQLEFEERVTHADGSEHIYLSRKFPLRDAEGRTFAVAGVSTDITRLRSVEDELKRARERLELCVRGTSDGLWDWDLSTNAVWFARRFRELLGYTSRDEFPDRFESLITHLHADDRARTMEAIEHHLDTDEPCDIEFRLRLRCGAYRWFHARGLSTRDESGRPVRMAGSIQDIHERKQAEVERQQLLSDLRERIKELSTLYEVSRVLQDHETSTHELLQRVIEPLCQGYQHTDVAAARIVFDGQEYTSANWLASPWRHVSAFETNDGRSGTVEVVYLEERPDADEGPFLTEERRLLDTIAARLCARLDRLYTDAQLRRSEERFRTLVANLPGVVYRCRLDDQWTMIYLSETAEELTGIPAGEFLRPNGRSFAELIDPEDNARNRILVNRAAERDEPFELEYRLQHVDGTPRWVIEKGQCVRNERGEVAYLDGVVFDVTELHRAREIEQEHRHLQDAVRAMEQVLAVVGHELRTPLAAIRAMTELLISSGENALGEQAPFLTSVHDEAVRMAQMVNNMLEAARLNSGHARWNWSTVELQRACDEAIAVVRPLVDHRSVTLNALVEPESLQMQGDHDAIQRLIINLVSNAAKFTSAGSIDVALRGFSSDDERWIELRVRDTGEGISEEKVRKLGQAFVLNAGVVGTDYVKGSGLGLAICTGIVEAHGGNISVSSEVGAGSTFTARLRADLPGPREVTATNAHQNRTAAASSPASAR